MLKNEMVSYVRIGGRDLKNLTYPYMVVGVVKNCQNYAYIINEWLLKWLWYLEKCKLVKICSRLSILVKAAIFYVGESTSVRNHNLWIKDIIYETWRFNVELTRIMTLMWIKTACVIFQIFYYHCIKFKKIIDLSSINYIICMQKRCS